MTQRHSGYGAAPITAAAIAATVLALTLVAGGIGAAQAMNAPSPAGVQRTSATAQPTPSTGANAPVADPSTPPDRDSDHTSSTHPKDKVYFIRPGDTLTSISARLKVSVDAIADYNAVRDVDVISAGSVLRVPFIYVPPTAIPAPAG